MKRIATRIFWLLLALAGGWAYAALSLHRGEGLNSAWILVAALCSYAIGYRFYSKWIATRVLMLNDRRATPCEVHDDGKDFVRTNKWIAFGQHFAAISGPGPLVGPVLAAQFGYLPGTLWILIGVTLGGAVQDFVVLFASLRRDGKSLGQMVKEELDTTAGAIALAAILAIIIILLAVLALVVVKTLAESPWGLFTVGATVPIAMFMGGYLRFVRAGKVMEASVIGVVLLLLAVWGGKQVHECPRLAAVFGLSAIHLAWGLIVYGMAASVLPVWLLLAPRGYLSTFMKLGTIFALALGIFLVLPDLRMPPVTKFVDGSGLIIAGKVFPFCFITIACGAISGFHTLIASGTTPKILTRESYARPVGYGAMCLESLVAIMAIIAACTLDPGVYFGMNIPSEGADSQMKAAAITRRIEATGAPFAVNAQTMDQTAALVKEKTLFNRTGGAATLAAGMAGIFAKVTQGRWVDLWYHFAIMFEALFILTTLDAGTRVGRYVLQDLLGSVWRPLGETKNLGANFLASSLMVGGWGYFLIQGVRDPLGGINSLWPLFGIANQLLAAIGLCLGTTIILKMQLAPAQAPERTSSELQSTPPEPALVQASSVRSPPFRVSAPQAHAEAWTPNRAKPVLALLTFVPLAWLLAVTTTAGVEKIFHSDPTIGFLAAAKDCRAKCARLEAEVPGSATPVAGTAYQNPEQRSMELKRLRALEGNNILDAFVAGTFLALVWFILVLSVREWILLLDRRKPAVLRESDPVWLPEYALREGSPVRVAGVMTLAFALAKEVSGQGAIERAQVNAKIVEAPAEGPGRPTPGQVYAAASEGQFKGFTRCC